jgi:hypothetical protein
VRRRAGTQIGAPVVELREVRLWDRWVLIDEAGGVWCQGCCRAVSLEELYRRDSLHLVRPPGWQAGIVEITFDGADSSQPDAPWRLQW